MTLIGPRPERPAFCVEFEKRIHGWHYRTMVTPGLSGLAQVTGGYDLLPKEKVVLDLWRWGNSRPLSRFNTVVSTIARYSVCGVLSRDMWCSLVRFGNHGVPIRLRFR